jgi:hypothetical protein
MMSGNQKLKGSGKRRGMSLPALFAFVAACCTLLSATCREGQKPTEVAEGLSSKTFVGPWLANTVDISIETKDAIGGPDHIHYDSKQLAAAQGRKPAITIYNGDGSYREEIFNLGDSLVQAKAGFWHFYEDSLFMRLAVDGSPKIAFQVAQEGKGLRLSNKIDWDGDGSKDDEMIVSLKRP